MRAISRGDLDGFFGLFIDNLLQLMLILALGTSVCGFSADLVARQILPGAALSILLGNLFYSWQAGRLARRQRRDDVTALPFGINTPSLIAFAFLIIGPVYRETGDALVAWRVGLVACLISGVIEIAGAFCGDWLRRHTPRAALLSALAGIALTFLAMGFAFQIFAVALFALVPLFLILAGYGGHVRWPFDLPTGLLAVTVGTALAWIFSLAGWIPAFQPGASAGAPGLFPPRPVPSDLLALIGDPAAWRHLAVIGPLALMNVIGSLQNLESAEAAGDRYETRPSLLANGCATIGAALFGSAFPTTIYIGHPGWKTLGARTSYSTLNGIAISAVCLTGAVGPILRVVPIEATLGILAWISIAITSQAFREIPPRHTPAAAFGLIPALAAWALHLVETTLHSAGASLHDVAPKLPPDLAPHGMISLSQGFLLTSMIFAAILACLADRAFLRAALWALAAAILSCTGVIHAYTLAPQGIRNRLGFLAAPDFACAYLAVALILLFVHRSTRPASPQPSR